MLTVVDIQEKILPKLSCGKVMWNSNKLEGMFCIISMPKLC